jgi:uncharacterized protein YegP (UPF0339 family)
VGTKVDTVEFFRDALGEWRWRYIRSDGEALADSVHGYLDRRDCVAVAEYLFVEGELAFTYEED